MSAAHVVVSCVSSELMKFRSFKLLLYHPTHNRECSISCYDIMYYCKYMFVYIGSEPPIVDEPSYSSGKVGYMHQI